MDTTEHTWPEPPPPRWEHQEADLIPTRDMPGAAIHWEPRLGKSRLAVETAAHLRGARRIDAAVITAPAGVHVDWAVEHVPRFYGPWAGAPEDEPPLVVAWQSSRTGTKAFREDLTRALAHRGMVFFCCNVEGLQPKSKLTRYLERFVARRRPLWVLDESHQIKNYKAKRTKTVHRLALKCPFRRLLTGTPTVQGPFDLWAQYYVIDPRILGRRFVPFKARYGIFERVRYGKDAKAFDQLVEYRNLDDLKRRIAPYTFTRRKADCLDLPERVEVVRRFEMPPAHARAYRQLVEEARAELADGLITTAPQALQRLLRLQQVARGYTQPDDVEHTVDLGGPYPAADEVVELVRQNQATGGKSIVWARFRNDLDRVADALQEAGIGFVRCDGAVAQADRPELRQRFREDDDVVVWIGTTQTGGIGTDLGAANLMIFYSHGFALGDRLQALERNYGSTQKSSRVDVVDIVAAGTVDERALAILKEKAELADQVAVEPATDPARDRRQLFDLIQRS